MRAKIFSVGRRKKLKFERKSDKIAILPIFRKILLTFSQTRHFPHQKLFPLHYFPRPWVFLTKTHAWGIFWGWWKPENFHSRLRQVFSIWISSAKSQEYKGFFAIWTAKFPDFTHYSQPKFRIFGWMEIGTLYAHVLWLLYVRFLHFMLGQTKL